MTFSEPISKNSFASNIPKYFIYTALKNLGFGLFVAIWVIYLQQRRGLSMTQATIIDVTFFYCCYYWGNADWHRCGYLWSKSLDDHRFRADGHQYAGVAPCANCSTYLDRICWNGAWLYIPLGCRRGPFL